MTAYSNAGLRLLVPMGALRAAADHPTCTSASLDSAIGWYRLNDAATRTLPVGSWSRAEIASDLASTVCRPTEGVSAAATITHDYVKSTTNVHDAVRKGRTGESEP
jgi:hypothetical protein